MLYESIWKIVNIWATSDVILRAVGEATHTDPELPHPGLLFLLISCLVQCSCAEPNNVWQITVRRPTKMAESERSKQSMGAAVMEAVEETGN